MSDFDLIAICTHSDDAEPLAGSPLRGGDA
jgi:hypothetical protein